MAGLISPKPIYTPQYNPYQRGLGTSGYADTPPIPSAQLAHPIPHQPVGQFIGSALGSAPDVREDGKIYALVIDLMDPNTREGALLELSKKREQYDDLALVLWHSFGELFPLRRTSPDGRTSLSGIMPALLQEIVSVYPLLS